MHDNTTVGDFPVLLIHDMAPETPVVIHMYSPRLLVLALAHSRKGLGSTCRAYNRPHP